MSLESSRKKSIRVYDLCTGEKKEHSLSVGCWSRQISTKFRDVIQLLRSSVELEGAVGRLECLSNEPFKSCLD